MDPWDGMTDIIIVNLSRRGTTPEVRRGASTTISMPINRGDGRVATEEGTSATKEYLQLMIR